MKLKFALIYSFFLFAFSAKLHSQACISNDTLPFKTDSVHFLTWNGEKYVPFFIKGVNLGIAVPGTFPGELKATREEYARWFYKIKETGFNCIRIYTLHYPHFYEVLDSFNRANPQFPLYFFQGIWLEEELPNYDHDIYFMTDTFDFRIKETMDCLYGNKIIASRPGKADGEYKTDASPWLMGYIIGREVHPEEVLLADINHPTETSYTGTYVSISNASPTETWLTKRIDKLLIHEKNTYGKHHPVSFSSWPTLDPLYHPSELNRMEDTVGVDLTKMDISKMPAGYFASYHAYPYYPDFISKDPKFTPYADAYGQNSYLGYLSFLKNHYNKFPLILAEFGTPSSWGIAHFGHSGMHHGGRNEIEQGHDAIRMFQNMIEAKCGGGIYFAWMDEWFKRTWISDPLDYINDRRVLWHNLVSAEQNYGVIGFKKDDFEMARWAEFCSTCEVTAIDAGADFDFFHLTLHLQSEFLNQDTIYISFDTYAPNLGESILPNGKTVSNRAEFCLKLTNYKAELLVTEAYDLFGLWHQETKASQHHRSIPSDGGQWNLLRLKTNHFEHEVQYIGSMGVKRAELPVLNTDAVIIDDKKISIRIPWNLLHFVDPSTFVVFNDDKQTWGYEDTITDGISISVFRNGFEATPPTRFLWETWNHALSAKEVDKPTRKVLQNRLGEIQNPPIAKCDKYYAKAGEILKVNADSGVLSNDIHFEGNTLVAQLFLSPQKGSVELLPDGSFTYTPFDNQSGTDYFLYKAFGTNTGSEAVHVHILIEGPDKEIDFPLIVYPNPSKDFINIETNLQIHYLEMYNTMGQRLFYKKINANSTRIDISEVPNGMYFIRTHHADLHRTRKIVVQREAK
jgi:hypothetical protein